MESIVVLGSGLAGYTVVRELRKQDGDIAVTLVSRDDGDFYSKPMLSNAYAQRKDAAGLVQMPAVQMAKQLGIELRSRCEASAIDTTNKRLHTTQGVLAYDRLVLAAGADPIRIPLQGDATDAVLSVNDIADYARFRAATEGVKHISIMGGGLIGCEFANDLAAAGFAVSVIDPGAYPLASLMPEQAGMRLLQPLAALGVDWRFGVSVSSVDAAPAGYALTLSDGSRLQTGLVLSAVGLRPRTALAKAAGLAVSRMTVSGLRTRAKMTSSSG